jgi:hypothetical protein
MGLMVLAIAGCAARGRGDRSEGRHHTDADADADTDTDTDTDTDAATPTDTDADTATDAATDTDTDAALPPTSRQIEIVRGHGMLAPEMWPAGGPLEVRIHEAGRPIAGARVSWSITSGDATISGTESFTDAAGLAQIGVRGAWVPPSRSTTRGVVRAAADRAGSVDFIVTSVDTGTAALNPHVELVAPSPRDLGTATPGELRPSAIQARAVPQAGPESGRPIPDVGIRLEGPLATCASPTGITLSGPDGLSSCTVHFSTTPGAGTVTVIVGEVTRFEAIPVRIE